MAQPTLNILTITPNLAAWEADVNTNFATLASAFEDNPLIVKFYTSKASLPAAGSNDHTLAIVFGDANAYIDGLYRSDGTNWLQQLTLDYEGDGQILVSHDGQVVGQVRRRSSIVGHQSEIEFLLNDSTSAAQAYASICAEIRVNTNGSEEGDVVLKAADGSGALIEVARGHGLEGHFRSAGSNGVGADTLANANALTDLVDGDEMWITDGRKNGEGAAAGTGVRAYYDSTSGNWMRHTDDTAVAN